MITFGDLLVICVSSPVYGAGKRRGAGIPSPQLLGRAATNDFVRVVLRDDGRLRVFRVDLPGDRQTLCAQFQLLWRHLATAFPSRFRNSA